MCAGYHYRMLRSVCRGVVALTLIGMSTVGCGDSVANSDDVWCESFNRMSALVMVGIVVPGDLEDLSQDEVEEVTEAVRTAGLHVLGGRHDRSRTHVGLVAQPRHEALHPLRVLPRHAVDQLGEALVSPVGALVERRAFKAQPQVSSHGD